MKRLFKLNWMLILVAPVVGFAIMAGLWLSVTAAYENIRLARASNQLLGVVAKARDMTVEVSADGKVLTSYLIDRLVQEEGMHVVKDPQTNARVLVNPWDHLVDVALLPPTQQLKLMTEMPAVACRRLILSYASEVTAFKLQHMEAWNAQAAKAPRLIYDAAITDKTPLRPDTVLGGCGRNGWVVLSLTFSLR